jgi:4'-phosphopantetheinyl transferase
METEMLSLPGRNLVHVWVSSLEASDVSLTSYKRLLSRPELDRAARFHFDQHRNRFIIAHGWLRQLLSQYLSIPPATLEFHRGAHGKPALAGSGSATRLEFSLAHSEQMSLIAVAHGIRVGVDLERIRELADAQELVDRFFSNREAAQFQSLSEEQKRLAFFNLWTRKEAWLKATGEGIGHLLGAVEVTFVPGERAQLVSLPQGETTNWSLFELDPGPGFTAALAVAAADAQCVQRHWDHERGQSLA